MDELILLTVLFSRINFKTNVENTLGAARPQTCARVLRTLDPQLANERSWEKLTSSACRAGVTKS